LIFDKIVLLWRLHDRAKSNFSQKRALYIIPQKKLTSLRLHNFWTESHRRMGLPCKFFKAIFTSWDMSFFPIVSYDRKLLRFEVRTRRCGFSKMGVSKMLRYNWPIFFTIGGETISWRIHVVEIISCFIYCNFYFEFIQNLIF
jgi:hypothetical protein